MVWLFIVLVLMLVKTDAALLSHWHSGSSFIAGGDWGWGCTELVLEFGGCGVGGIGYNGLHVISLCKYRRLYLC